jgi:O-antigen/teichoic acid export membrane protein
MGAMDTNRCSSTRVSQALWSGSAWTIAAVAVSRGSAVIAGVIVARILGRDVFGEFGAVESSVVMLALLANAGLSLTSSKFVARYRRTDPGRAGRVLGLCLAAGAVVALLMTIGVCVGSSWLARASLGAPHLAGVLRIAAAIIFFSSVNGAMNGALIGFQAFRRIARVNLLASAMTIPVMTLAAMTGGLMGAVLGLLAVQAWTSVVLLVELTAEARASSVVIRLREAWRERGVLTSFSLPALLNATLVSPVNWLCVVPQTAAA